jgi:hypothetical protein
LTGVTGIESLMATVAEMVMEVKINDEQVIGEIQSTNNPLPHCHC